MTAQDMLDMALGLVDEPRRSALERQMAADPSLSTQMDTLGSRIGRMLDDGEDYEPPAGLASRTIALVEHRRRKPHLQDFAPSRVPFRWGDVAVAATVFLAAILTLTVPLMRQRAQLDQAACAFNLQQLGQGFGRYATAHHGFPFVKASLPAGAYGVMLHDSHNLTDPNVLSCPASAKARGLASLPNFKAFCELFDKSPESCREMLDGHFAYNVGYRDPSGKTVPVPDAPSFFTPLASDGPSCDGKGTIHEGNSPNHGGAGQNVLFTDGHVAWKRTRWMSHADHDLFLNAAHQPGPGLHPGDSALMPSVLPVSAK